MDSFLFAVNAVLPIILLVALGYALKKLGLIRMELAKALNKLVFRVFLPVTLFLNIYKLEGFASISLGYIGYALCVILGFFLLSIPFSCLVTKDPLRRGPLSQVVFRSNFALVGLPLAALLFGDAGIATAALLSAPSVPLFNVLAVISLSLFAGGEKKASVRDILLGIIKNPLIIAVFSGLLVLGVRGLLTSADIAFRLSDLAPLYKAAEYLSDLSTPLALLALGAQFEFSAVKELRREIVAGTLARVLFVPLVGIGVAFLFSRDRFSGAQFAALVALFATPVAVSSLPMAQEMGNDARLAGQLVVWTTLFSAFSIFLASLLLRLAGVF